MPFSTPTPAEIQAATDAITNDHPGDVEALTAVLQPAAEVWALHLSDHFKIAPVAHQNPIFLSAIAFGVKLGLRIGFARRYSAAKSTSLDGTTAGSRAASS